ncbi:SCO-spondin [Aplysia californica]|uniref:SCO-spondin n=1 Tax=Aplysia californica TaxID=6500 RepID=A0ABM1A4V0_APLCA|nr:SCO-spondin [Aplysia californica]
MFRSLKWAVALALLALIHTSAGRQISSEPFGNVEDAGYSFVSTEEDREYPVDPVELVDEDSIESEEDDLFDENDDDVDDDDNDDDEPLDEFPVIEGGLEEDEEEEEQENSFKTDLELLEGNISTKTDVDFEKDNDIMMGDQPAPTEKKKKGKKNKKRRKGKGKKRKGKGKRKGRKNKGERKRKGKKAATSDVKPILAKNATLPGLNGTNLQADMPKLWVDENGKLVVDESDPLSGVQGQDPKDPDNFWPDINGDPKNPWRKEQPWPGNDPRAANRSPWTAVDPRAVNANTNNNNINNNPHRNEPWSQTDPRTGRVNQPVPNNRQPNIWPDPSNRVVPDMGNTNKYFDVGPLEVFMQNCPDCFVQVPGAVCPFHGPAIELKKWAGELEDVLSHGCKRPEECKEPGTCCLSRIAPFEPTIVRMTQMLKDVYNMVQRNCKGCGVDGNWSPWGPWNTCDRTCGPGTRIRTRECNNPAPSLTGKTCVGESMDRKDCFNPDCCVNGNWGMWTSWGQCPVTCGRSQVSRSRQCSNPPPNHCGQTCPGNPYETKNEYCGPEPVNGNWAMWQQWSPCTRTCDFGTRTRIRTCTNPAPNACGMSCPGSASEEAGCNNPSCLRCVDGNWASWGPWSNCPVTCGDSTVSRSRTCSNPPPNGCGRECFGDPVESKLQNCGPREQHGNWAMWSSWSQCSASCGPGTYTRSRTCSAPPANLCGRQCDGQSFQTAPCNREDCRQCVDGNWGQWNSWSQCPMTCGESTVTRTRYCNSPPPNFCGVSCPGSGTETKRELCGPPAQDGNWAMWSSWSQCSTTCGPGTYTRTRTCSNPPASACGRQCPGPAFESGTCQQQPCRQCVDGNWGSWASWSQCSTSCGDGMVSRTRMCNNPPNNFCGTPCLGDDRESKQTQCGPRRDDGRWSPWGSWSRCSATCGRGQRRRTRSCSNPFPNACSRSCAGPDFEVDYCDGPSCEPVCVDGNWGSWGRWSQCPVTCGDAEVTRTRMCNNPAPNVCGQRCPGSDREAKLEMCGPPAVDGGWTSWGSWSQCSATCGRGVQTRSRTCRVVVAGRNCGLRGCEGRDREQQACRDAECARYTYDTWGAWCPCDCRTGKQTRRRECVRVDDRGRRVPAELGLCQGDAREEKYCDVRRFCPACITSCENQPDGDYPSCYGCQEYIRCKDRVAEPFTCNRGNTEWDAFVRKCVSPPSPSCALAAPVTDCTNTVDGKYHSDRGCNDYIECVNGVLNNQMCPRRDMEFNLHLQTCEDGRTKSPTCIRQARRTPEINLAIIGGAVKPVNDAPADMYYDERNGLSPVERRERYEKERLEAEMTREKDARRARLLAEKLRDLERKENRLVLGGEKVESRRRVNPGCVRSCDGLTTGRYPSCRGCNYFVICTIRGRFRERKCSHNHEFDILRERCRKHSHSCILE